MKTVLFIKKGKSFIILSALVLSNLLVFSVLKNASASHSALSQSQDIREMEYVRDGMEIISWNYALLKYFKNNSPNT